jgi:hypothetical protein
MPDPNEGWTKENYLIWRGRLARQPANPYADPESPESQSVHDPSNPFLQRYPDTITGYSKECRDGGKARKEETSGGD